MADQTFNLNVPQNPVFKTTRTGEPTSGPDVGWYFSPDENGNREFLGQKNHRTPTNVFEAEEFTDYFARLQSLDAAGWCLSLKIL